MGPVSAKSDPGREPLRTEPEPTAGRAKQEIDYGRHGVAGGVNLPINGE